MDKQNGKPEVVVITGASAGVGRATAVAFAKRGASVGLLARGRHRGGRNHVTSREYRRAPQLGLPLQLGPGLFFSVRSLAEIGFTSGAERFRRFIERSAAGGAEGMQIMYGVGGERRLTETTLEHLEGYRGARAVRAGNSAANQLQLDAYGTLLELTWRWHLRGNSPDDDYWRFLMELVENAAKLWNRPDHGIWEVRGKPRHFVHSKVMCWAALDRGLRLAEECMRKAPVEKWENTRDEIR